MRVLICGGGVIGASIAYFLKCRGVEAIVVERTGIARAASGKSGGFLALDWRLCRSRRPLRVWPGCWRLARRLLPRGNLQRPGYPQDHQPARSGTRRDCVYSTAASCASQDDALEPRHACSAAGVPRAGQDNHAGQQHREFRSGHSRNRVVDPRHRHSRDGVHPHSRDCGLRLDAAPRKGQPWQRAPRYSFDLTRWQSARSTAGCAAASSCQGHPSASDGPCADRDPTVRSRP